MISVRTDSKALLNALKMLGGKLAPEAVSKTLNQTADAVGNKARRNAKSRLKIRRPYSLNSIKQDRKAKGNIIERMFSRVVVGAKYMVAQELGLDSEPRGGYSQVPIPSEFSRGGKIMGIIKQMFRLNKLEPGNIGGKYDGAGTTRFFIGKPKGGSRKMGIWFRHNKNKKLTMIRSLTQTKVVQKPVKFFQDAVRKFGSNQYLIAMFSKNAQEAIKKAGLPGKI
jgi:hypothetical protein